MNKDDVVRFDWAMKRMLRDKANFTVLEGLLTVLMREKITILELLESEANQQTESQKFNRVDIKARDSKDEIIIFEIQNTREVYFLERILFGVAKAVTEHISLGAKYDEVKKIISVSIVYFDLGKGKDYVYHGQNKFIGVHSGDELQITTRQRNALVTQGTEKIFPEYYLLRVNNFDEVAKTPLAEWMEYLKTGRISESATAPGLPEARERLRIYNMDDRERRAYESHLNDVMIENDVMDTSREEGYAEGMAKGLSEGMAKGMSEGMAKGIAEGLAEGEAQGEARQKREIAANLKAMGLPVEQIKAATGLSEEEIKKL